ncbi:MAG TPA: hypothetical protein DD435_13690 [Cyanobacteria bacterium UBA8530]|nr:hypothetical protein [Cyanobacteria bacterium UBA8530]
MRYPLLRGEIQVIKSAFPKHWRSIKNRLETIEGKTLADRMEQLKAERKKTGFPAESPETGTSVEDLP